MFKIPVLGFINTQFSELESQRLKNIEHVMELRDYYFKPENRIGLTRYTPVYIGVFNGNRYLLDGQHRYWALKELKDFLSPDDRIEIREFVCETAEELNTHFRLINSTRPLESYFVTNDIEKTIKFTLISYLKENFSEFIVSTNKPHAPNFNLDTLIKRIDIDVVKRWFDIMEEPISVDAFMHRFKEMNIECLEYLREHRNDSDIVNGYNRLVVKPIHKQFCGGFNMNWFEVAFNNQEPTMFRRSAISASLKTQVWRRYTTYFKEVKCCGCDKSIQFPTDGECGHIISHFNGGKTELFNLMPICGDCNKSCSYKNLDKFLSELGRDIKNYVVPS